MNITGSDEKLADEDELECIGTKRKRRGEINEDDGNDSDIEEVQDGSNQRAGSIKE
jgi:hypothetical protein